MRGASALDELLARLKDARIRVLVVWEPVLKTDLVAPLSRVLGLIGDRRVSQYWDPERIVSAGIVRAVNANPASYRREDPLPPGFVAWDVVAVFGPSRTWDHDLAAPVYYGGPVIDVIHDTQEALIDALEGPAERSGVQGP